MAKNVYLVRTYVNGDEDTLQAFSSKEKAREFMEAIFSMKLEEDYSNRPPLDIKRDSLQRKAYFSENGDLSYHVVIYPLQVR